MQLDEVRHLLTYDCNLRCRHCYLSAGERRSEIRRFNQVELDRFYSFFAPKVVSATGGEPLLEKELVVRLARSTARYGGILELVTNGFFLDEKIAGDLQELNPSIRYQISLDGPETYHNELRGHPDAFVRALNAISIAAASGATTKVRLTVTDENFALIREVITLLDSLGHRNVILVMRPLIKSGRAVANQLAWTQPLDRLLELEQTAACVEVRTTDIHERCSCGLRTVAIDPSGCVYPCTYLAGDPHYLMGSIREPDMLSEHPAFREYDGKCFARSLAMVPYSSEATG